MVDFLFSSIGDEVEDDKKNQPFSDPLGLQSVTDFDEFSLSFADSLLDFDSLGDLISDSPMADSNQEPSELVSVEFRSNDGVSDRCKLQMEDPLSCLNQEQSQIGVSEECEVQVGDPLSCLNREQSQIGVSEKCEVQTGDPLSCLNREQSQIGVSENGLKVEDLDCVVEEKMGRVSISGTENERVVDQADVGNCSGSVAAAAISKNEESDNKVVISNEERIVHDTGVNGNGNTVNNSDTESENESERESESPSSSSASSSDSDEDESSSNDEAEEEEVDMEEGEILASDPDEMVNWDNDEEDSGVKGPIRSKNEVQVIITFTLHVNAYAFEILIIAMFEPLMKVKYLMSMVFVPLKLS